MVAQPSLPIYCADSPQTRPDRLASTAGRGKYRRQTDSDRKVPFLHHPLPNLQSGSVFVAPIFFRCEDDLMMIMSVVGHSQKWPCSSCIITKKIEIRVSVLGGAKQFCSSQWWNKTVGEQNCSSQWWTKTVKQNGDEHTTGPRTQSSSTLFQIQYTIEAIADGTLNASPQIFSMCGDALIINGYECGRAQK